MRLAIEMADEFKKCMELESINLLSGDIEGAQYYHYKRHRIAKLAEREGMVDEFNRALNEIVIPV